jgi:hypothetical protein
MHKLKEIFGSYSKAAEILQVMHGIKAVVRQGFYENEISKVKDFCIRNGLALEIAPYKVVLTDPYKRYSNKGFKARIDDPRKGMFFAYISKDGNKAATAKVLEMKNDHKRLGLLLGYPECCIDFFIQNEPERSRLDNDYSICTLKNSKARRFPFFTNVFKRSKDAVLISHFPCSFDCEKSIEIAKRNLQLIGGIDLGLASRIVSELKGRVKVGNKEIEFY